MIVETWSGGSVKTKRWAGVWHLRSKCSVFSKFKSPHHKHHTSFRNKCWKMSQETKDSSGGTGIQFSGRTFHCNLLPSSHHSQHPPTLNLDLMVCNGHHKYSSNYSWSIPPSARWLQCNNIINSGEVFMQQPETGLTARQRPVKGSHNKLWGSVDGEGVTFAGVLARSWAVHSQKKGYRMSIFLSPEVQSSTYVPPLGS